LYKIDEHENEVNAKINNTDEISIRDFNIHPPSGKVMIIQDLVFKSSDFYQKLKQKCDEKSEPEFKSKF
jgi:hypothetical protein